ncbi:MAG: hypothetical protein N3A66_12420, partial [Planctomycetota bacterium]|nr:hypothetical protein [Planctomycetota bacterium]
ILCTAGGGNRLWPRDIAAAADGQALAAGFALEGTSAIYGAKGQELWSTPSGIVYKMPAPGADALEVQRKLFEWETRKDSERFLAVSPDHTKVAVSAKGRFELRDLASGALLWKVDSEPTKEERGAAFPQPAWSSDGSRVLVYRMAKQKPLTPEGKSAEAKKAALAKIEKEMNKLDVDEIGKTPAKRDELLAEGKPTAAKASAAEGETALFMEAVLVEASTGKPIWQSPHSVYDWELYAAVGPRGLWTITA